MIFEQLLFSELSMNSNDLDNFEGDSKGDSIDKFNAEKELSMNLKLNSRMTVYKKKVRKALQKIQDGSFGECEDCGCEISDKRLFARPTATLCIQCKEHEERSENGSFNKNRYSVVHSTKSNFSKQKPSLILS